MPLSLKEEIELIQLLEHENKMQVPAKLEPIWKHYRYKIIHGGRGSAKSWTVAKYFIETATKKKKKVLCTREIQKSIKESVYELLVETIGRLNAPGWVIKNDELVNKNTGSKFTFKGLRDLAAADQIKSYEGYDACWVEEAHSVKFDIWKKLTPTFRKKGSEIIATFNRYEDADPVYELFCNKNDPDILEIEINWRDNPWFSDTVLKADMERDKKDDYDLYLHTWENYPIAQLEKAVIPRNLVNEAMNREVKPEGALVVGVDMARFGGDSITFYARRGYKIIARYCHKHQDSVDTCNDLVHFTLENGGSIYTPINIDNGGLGAGGLVDMMRKIKDFKNIRAVNFGGVPKNPNKYKDIATEMYFEIKEIMDKIELPNIKNLRQDLCGRLYGYNDKQQRKIEPKEKFKERYGRSPDDGDGCLLCFYEPVGVIKISSENKQQLKTRRIERKNRAKRRLIT